MFDKLRDPLFNMLAREMDRLALWGSWSACASPMSRGRADSSARTDSDRSQDAKEFHHMHQVQYAAAHKNTILRPLRMTIGKESVQYSPKQKTNLLRIPKNVLSLEPSLCCSSDTVAVSTVGGASVDAMMGSQGFLLLSLELLLQY